MKTIIDLLEFRTKDSPNAIAVIYNDKSLTYSQLGGMVNFAEKDLLESKVGPQEKVAILLPNSLQFIASFFAVAKVGAVAMTLNTNYRDEEVKHYLNKTEVRRLISKNISEMDSKQIKGRKICSYAKIKENDEVLQQFSSGSTAIPKRVGRTHQNILKEAEAISDTIKVSSQDRILCSVPLFHAYGFGCGMMTSIYSGAAIVLINRFNPREVIHLLEKSNITIFLGVPYMFEFFSRVKLKGKIKLPYLKYCFSAGISLSLEVAEKFYNRFGIFPRQLYGTTETGCLTINLNEDIKGNLDSVGKPIKWVKVDFTSSGEIIVKSPAGAKYYYDKKNKAIPLLKNGYFLTGDLGKTDEGRNLYIIGRKTSFINVAGVKVDPREVEDVLRTFPGIKEAVVTAIKDRLRGEAVKAVIVPNGKPIDKIEVIRYCRSKIADFKIPRIIELRNNLPKSSLGKILKGYL